MSSFGDPRLSATVDWLASHVTFLDADRFEVTDGVIGQWLLAIVAHEPCRGTGDIAYEPKSRSEAKRLAIQVGDDLQTLCPGPHVEIEIVDPETYVPATHLTPSEIDGFVLYADGVGVTNRQPVRELLEALRDRDALPDGWRL